MSLKDGEVSQVLKTQFGYHFMQMIKRRGENHNARHVLLRARPPAPTFGVARSTWIA